MADYQYQFPEKKPFRAMEVTDLKFKIEEQPDWLETLFVDFESIRSQQLSSKFDFRLGIENGRLENIPVGYEKMIFSGHMGSGKSVELHKYADRINHSEAYFVVPVDLEKETNIEQLEAEDILVTMISILVRELKLNGANFEEDDFAAIAEELISSEEDVKEVSKELGIEADAKVSVGWNLWKFFGIEGNLKGAYSRNNKTTQVVRQTIKANYKPILNKFNIALASLRISLRNQQKGRDILFVVDGLEKAQISVYESLFIKDVQLIAGINAHMISTVPIRTYYEIQSLGTRDTFIMSYLPMLRLNEESKRLLKEMVYKRVSDELFEEDVIKTLIEMSGGCPRILLKLVNRSIIKASRAIVTLDHAKKVCKEEGQERWMALTQNHRNILKKGDFMAADPEVLDLLQYLSILEYNGDRIDRKVNPLLIPFLATENG